MQADSKARPRIVVIGGGTGLSVMLRGLKEKPVDITAIVTVADDGGSSGVLRQELDIPPPGDIRNVLLALADSEGLLAKVLHYRFANGKGLAGHSLGNLILAALTEISGDFVTGIQELSRVLAVRGQVLPAAADAIVLKAELSDGTIITGESRIPKAGKKIKRVFLDEVERIVPLPAALEAIRQADTILIGPGSLYTSILPNLLVPQITEEIVRSRAVKVYICNVMTQPGETDGYSVGAHIEAIYQHVGQRLFDYAIVHEGELPADLLGRYAQEGAVPVSLDREHIQALGCRVIADELVILQTYLRHNAERLSEHIYRLSSGLAPSP